MDETYWASISTPLDYAYVRHDNNVTEGKIRPIALPCSILVKWWSHDWPFGYLDSIMNNHDVHILRELAQQYVEIAAKPIQDERRTLWTDHNSLRPTRPLVLATYGMWNVWCREVFGDHAMQCADPFYRNYERWLRMELFRDDIGDDYIQEPWITVPAVQKVTTSNMWGVEHHYLRPGVEGGAWMFDPAIRDWSDIAKISPPPHEIDEHATAQDVAKLSEAIGDLLAIDVNRGPVARGFWADISTHIARLRGLEELMIDMYESPAQLHKLLAFMRDGVLANQAAAEAAGDYSRTSQENQCMTYCHELDPPAPNTHGARRDQLWAYCAAQEFTLISPAQHDEFMLQYQKPIIEQCALSAYGCCEDLTGKIDILRQIENLRIIAVAPRANVRRCAEQIGTDYTISWRPNPADMVCCGFNEDRIRTIIGQGLQAARGCHVHIHLKDIETVEGDPTRLPRWVKIAKGIAETVSA